MTNIQSLSFNPNQGYALPMPDWFKVVKQAGDKIVIEGLIPNVVDSSYRNLRVQIEFTFDSQGFNRLCTRRIRGEAQHWGTKNWRPYSSGARVLTHRMLFNLITAKTGHWW